MQTGNQRPLAHHVLYGVIMFAVILSAFGAWDVPNAHGQEALRGAVVSLSFDRPSFKAGDDVMVRVGITNATGAPIRILRWFTPLDGFERSLFTVSRDGKPVPYVGKMVKRAAPTEKDYVTLMAGKSLTSDADLSANYDLSVSGIYTVKYNVALIEGFARGNGEVPQRTSLTDSEIVELFVEGRPNRTPPAITPEAVTGSTSYVSCSSSQQTGLVAARNMASIYTQNAVAYLAAGGGSRYTEWFGASNSSRYATVQSHFNSLLSAVDTANPMTFDCTTCLSGANASAFAYVYANSPYKVYLCNAFWAAALTGTDSRGGALIHEISHFTAVAGTSDYVYGQTGARNLAISNPANAIMNADNHEYFAEAGPTTTTGSSIPATVATTPATTVATTTATTIDPFSTGGGGCFIATATYGSYLDPHVVVLRDFRDRYLETNKPGQYFVRWYYRNSPPIAELIRENETLRIITRVLLTPVILAIQYSTLSVILFALFALIIPVLFVTLKRQEYLYRKPVA